MVRRALLNRLLAGSREGYLDSAFRAALICPGLSVSQLLKVQVLDLLPRAHPMGSDGGQLQHLERLKLERRRNWHVIAQYETRLTRDSDDNLVWLECRP